MHLSLRNVPGLALLVGVAFASWYWNREEAALGTAASGGSSDALGYYLRDASISIMDEDGAVLYVMSADAIEERPAENRTVLSRINIKYSPAADVPWEVSADSGEIPNDEQYIELSGDVALVSTSATSGETTIIQTSRIRFAPDDSLVVTDGAVSMRVGEHRLDAVGLSADLKADYLELKSDIHGQFNP